MQTVLFCVKWSIPLLKQLLVVKLQWHSQCLASLFNICVILALWTWNPHQEKVMITMLCICQLLVWLPSLTWFLCNMILDPGTACNSIKHLYQWPQISLQNVHVNTHTNCKPCRTFPRKNISSIQNTHCTTCRLHLSVSSTLPDVLESWNCAHQYTNEVEAVLYNLHLQELLAPRPVPKYVRPFLWCNLDTGYFKWQIEFVGGV